MGSGLHTTDNDMMRENQRRDVRSDAQGDARAGGTRRGDEASAEANDAEAIASNTRGNGGLGNVVNMSNEAGENSTERALRRAADAQG